MVNINNFQYNSEYDWYESEIEINGISTEVYVHDEEIKDIEILNDRLKKGINWCKNNYETILDYCADNLLELKNKDWRYPDEKKVTKQEFKERLELDSICIEEDGRLAIWFQVGDWFATYPIGVETNSEYQFDCAYVSKI